MEVGIENFESPPQIAITLNVELALDFPWDPKPTINIEEPSVAEKASNNETDGVYASIKHKQTKRSKSEPIPEFKPDTDYQSIERFENIHPNHYAITVELSPPLDEIRRTVKIRDKPLIFAGRGYNISVFEKEVKPAISLDYSTHLVASPPDPRVKEVQDHLEPDTEYSRDIKNLIFNSTRFAFGKTLPKLVDKKQKNQNINDITLLVESVSDSVLMFPSGEKTLLVLRKAKKEYDLLDGNETLNKKQFNSASLKNPQTNSRILEIRQ